MAKRLTDEDIRKAILSRVAVPLWPHTGRALSLGKDATIAAERRGEIPVLNFLRHSKQKRVPTAFLRKHMNQEKVA
jgi:hypothetical protein